MPLTPHAIYNDLKNNFVDNVSAVELLITLIENVDNLTTRIDSIETLEKIKHLRDLKPELDIEVDGGIKPDTIKQVKEAGANIFVSGSFIMKNKRPAKAIHELNELIE